MQDFHEVFAHEVWLLLGPVVAFAVLEEAEEERVHTYFVDREEGAADEVRCDDDENDGREVIVGVGELLPQAGDFSAEGKEGENANAARHHHLANEQKEVRHLKERAA